MLNTIMSVSERTIALGGVPFLIFLGLLSLTGCATSVPPAADENWPQACPDAPVTLQSGDALRVRFAYWPELNEEQVIRPDGKIAMPLVGEIEAAGLNPEQLREELLKRYSSKVKDPDITVIVRSMDSRRVYVGGEVKTPGVISMPGRLTLLQAIMQAGGFMKESAKLSSVIVVRQQTGKQQVRSVDVRKMLKSPEGAPFFLAPFDIVFVPRTNIDRVDQWVEQYINRVIPRNIYASFTLNKTYADTNPGTQVQMQLPLP